MTVPPNIMLETHHQLRNLMIILVTFRLIKERCRDVIDRMHICNKLFQDISPLHSIHIDVILRTYSRVSPISSSIFSTPKAVLGCQHMCSLASFFPEEFDTLMVYTELYIHVGWSHSLEISCDYLQFQDFGCRFQSVEEWKYTSGEKRCTDMSCESSGTCRESDHLVQ